MILVAAEDGLEETELQMRNFLDTGGHAAIPWSEVLVLTAYAYSRGEARGSLELMAQAAELGRSIAARLEGQGQNKR